MGDEPCSGPTLAQRASYTVFFHTTMLQMCVRVADLHVLFSSALARTRFVVVEDRSVGFTTYIQPSWIDQEVFRLELLR